MNKHSFAPSTVAATRKSTKRTKVKEGFTIRYRAISLKKIIAGLTLAMLVPIPIIVRANNPEIETISPVWQTELVLSSDAPELLITSSYEPIIDKTTSRYDEHVQREAEIELKKAQEQKQLAQKAKANTAQKNQTYSAILAPDINGDKTQYRDLLTRYFTSSDLPVIEKIITCESKWNPNAIGDRNSAYRSYGLFQVRALPGRPSPEWLMVPENNIAYAARLYKAHGLKPWTCAKKIR